MSKLVDTDLGQFRLVTDGQKEWWLLECPCCHEMLPMDEELLAGRAWIDHESKTIPGTYCPFAGPHNFGEKLIAAMRALILMGARPYHDEGEDRWSNRWSRP